MAKLKRPEGYAIPLRSRKAITEFLGSEDGWKSRGGYDYDKPSGFWWFCFDVKLRRLDFDFDHLLEVAREKQINNKVNDPHYVEGCRQKFEVVDQDWLYESAVESAQFPYTGKYPHEQALFSGRQVKTEFAFYGRSGGWLTLRKFEGYTLDEDFSPSQMTYSELRRLYEYVVMLAHDTSGRKVEDEVEYHAAYILFESICDDVETSQDVEKTERQAASAPPVSGL